MRPTLNHLVALVLVTPWLLAACSSESVAPQPSTEASSERAEQRGEADALSDMSADAPGDTSADLSVDASDPLSSSTDPQPDAGTPLDLGPDAEAPSQAPLPSMTPDFHPTSFSGVSSGAGLQLRPLTMSVRGVSSNSQSTLTLEAWP